MSHTRSSPAPPAQAAAPVEGAAEGVAEGAADGAGAKAEEVPRRAGHPSDIACWCRVPVKIIDILKNTHRYVPVRTHVYYTYVSHTYHYTYVSTYVSCLLHICIYVRIMFTLKRGSMSNPLVKTWIDVQPMDCRICDDRRTATLRQRIR